MGEKNLIKLLDEARLLMTAGGKDPDLARALQEELTAVHGGQITPRFMEQLKLVKAIRPDRKKNEWREEYNVLSVGELHHLKKEGDSLIMPAYLAAESLLYLGQKQVKRVMGLGFLVLSNFSGGERQVSGVSCTLRSDRDAIISAGQRWARKRFEDKITKGLQRTAGYAPDQGIVIFSDTTSEDYNEITVAGPLDAVQFHDEQTIRRQIEDHYVTIVNRFADYYFGRLKRKVGTIGGEVKRR